MATMIPESCQARSYEASYILKPTNTSQEIGQTPHDSSEKRFELGERITSKDDGETEWMARL